MSVRSRALPLVGLLLAVTGCSGGSDGSNASQGDEAYTDAKPLFADKIGKGRTHHPILLEHGFASSAEPASIWRFAGVAQDLMAQGHSLVVAADVEPFNGVAARAATMERNVRDAVEKCKTIDGCDPSGIHVIAHSFGGLHAREYIRLHPPSKAAEEGLPPLLSLTTVATPNRGTNIADVGLSILQAFKDHPALDAAFNADVDKLAGLVGTTFTKEELVQDPNIEEALHDLSEANADDFAASHPADPDVKYYAWAGVSVNPDFILHPIHPERVTAALPPECGSSLGDNGDRAFATDLLLVAAHDVTGHFLDGLPNDGMSTVDSAKGLPGARFMGCIPADHLADVGHYSTDQKKAWSGFDHVWFYRYAAAFIADDER
jgi:pimeloyl-ACP methyl ester carboxylesterase